MSSNNKSVHTTKDFFVITANSFILPDVEDQSIETVTFSKAVHQFFSTVELFSGLEIKDYAR